MSGPLERLVAVLRQDGGLVAAAVLERPRPDGVDLGALVAAGPRAAGHGADLPLVIEAVREGRLLHCGRSRVSATADADLALLIGDRCYALGLELLAAAGDMEAIALLATLIADGAQARSGGDDTLAEVRWEGAAIELGWGPDPLLAVAGAAARPGDGAALDALRGAIADVRVRRSITL